MQLELYPNGVAFDNQLHCWKCFKGYGVSFYVLESDFQSRGGQAVLECLKQAFLEKGDETSLHNLAIIEREIG